MAKGNPNPDISGLNPFKKGQSGNPGGKTSEQRKAEIRAAEKAAIVQADLVDALANVLDSAEGDQQKLDHIRGDVLRLLDSVQDRAHGKPKQAVDLSSPDGSMSPSQHGDAVLDAIKARKIDTDPPNSGNE